MYNHPPSWEKIGGPGNQAVGYRCPAVALVSVPGELRRVLKLPSPPSDSLDIRDSPQGTGAPEGRSGWHRRHGSGSLRLSTAPRESGLPLDSHTLKERDPGTLLSVSRSSSSERALFWAHPHPEMGPFAKCSVRSHKAAGLAGLTWDCRGTRGACPRLTDLPRTSWLPGPSAHQVVTCRQHVPCHSSRGQGLSTHKRHKHETALKLRRDCPQQKPLRWGKGDRT